jgi:cytochrome c peroxidase
MDDDAAVLAALKSVPKYVEMFAAAFPEGGEPITMANLGRAIGAYERKLVTPAPFDRFMAGDMAALDEAQLLGLQYFLDVGCTQCHSGPAVGGMQFQKLGSIKPWPDLVDEGRAAHTKNAIDKFVFKVPSLRNVTETGPWLHDGSIEDLETMVGKMAEHQSARGKLTDAETKAIVAFLGSLKGELPKDLIKAPELPPGAEGEAAAAEVPKPTPI